MFPGMVWLCAGLWILISCSAGLLSQDKVEITDERSHSSYWIKPTATFTEPILPATQLKELNQLIRERSDGTVRALGTLDAPQSAQQVAQTILACISGYNPQDLDGLYADFTPLTATHFSGAIANFNLTGLPPTVYPRYALVLRRSDLRGLPQSQGWYHAPGDFNYDNLQVRALDPAEPLLVLHESSDHQYYFVLTSCAEGWVRVQDVVLVPRETFRSYTDPDSFVVLTKPQQRLQSGSEQVLLQMGARLPVIRLVGSDSFVAVLPATDRGAFVPREVVVTREQGFNPGYLALTRENLVQLAFAYRGSEYGWGGQNEGVDCSGLIRNLYRVMGVFLPNTSRGMLRVFPRSYFFTVTADETERLELIKREAQPGDCLLKNGHVVLYLGPDEQGEVLVIHALSSYFPQGPGTDKRYVRKVLVSDLRFVTATGRPLVADLQMIGGLQQASAEP